MPQNTESDMLVSEVARKMLELAESDAPDRKLLYSLRRGYYDGTIAPIIERGHDVVITEFAKTIVDKMSGYFMGNGFAVKIKPNDVSDEAQTVAARMANELSDDRYNKNEAFQDLMLEMAECSSRDGDAFIVKSIINGNPVHSLLPDPSHVSVLFSDDSFKEIDVWTVRRNLSIKQAKKQFDVEATAAPVKLDSYTAGTINTQRNPYGVPNQSTIYQPLIRASGRSNMAEYSAVHDLIEGKRTEFINGMMVLSDDAPEVIYHFQANRETGRPYGTADFESCAQLITKFEEKISEESDVVSQGSHPKIVTDQNVTDIQQKWRPNRTQAFQVKKGRDGSGYMEILNTNSNVQNNQALLGLLLNIIRTNSGLQELGQDQIAANVSGRAIQFMFQGVQNIIQKKRVRFMEMMQRLIVDDFKILVKGNPEMKKALFNDDGSFKLRIDIKFPPVLEQDEQIRIGNIQLMRQGGLISQYSARLLLSEYIDDPNEEQKRIEEEQEAKLAFEGKMAAIQQAAQPQPAVTQPTGTSTNGPTPPPLTQPGMQPALSSGPAAASGPGFAGAAQAQISPAGMAAQMQNNTPATPTTAPNQGQ